MKKNISKILLTVCMVFMAMSVFTSCEDYLTITPTDRTVEEDFWRDRNDLQGTLAACYLRMMGDDMMSKYIQWGEMRGDNFEKRVGVTAVNMTNLMNANLMSTNNIFDWTCFYNAINYCNKILAHGPEIVEKDETFSMGDWLPIKAEVTTLRALCHFYLTRTFCDVPYATEDYNNDSQRFELGQSTQMEVLDNIISDLEEVKDQAMKSYGNQAEDHARITRKTVYTLLADVYLWRASYKAGAPDKITDGTSAEDDYRRCVECCDYVLNQMKVDYEDQVNKSGTVIGGLTEEVKLEDLFVQNTENSSIGANPFRNESGAYNAIFGTGNSRESIFEFQFDGTNNVNSMLLNYFIDKNNSVQSLLCSSALFGAIETNPNTPVPSSVFNRTDYRRWTTSWLTKNDFSQTSYPLAKYNFSAIEQYNTSSSTGMRDNNATASYYNSATSGSARGSMNSANWIVYRLSDVVLMKAEALIQISDDEATLKEAFSLVREVFKRSNPYAYQNTTSANDSIDYKQNNTKDAIERLILNERQREFVGEGKRWYDLVRYAQRKGNTVEMLKYLTRKFTDNKRAIEAKLAPMMSLFSPIYNDEIKNNKLLHQNEVWGTSENTSKTDDL